MRHIVATLAVIALLFSAGSAWADDTSEANKLFVEAMQLWLSAEDEESLEKKAVALEASLAKLNKIFDEHPSTELAVKLISGQSVGDITLEDVRDAAESAREKADARVKFEMTLKLAEQGLAGAQFNLGVMYDKGRGVPHNDAEMVKWWRNAAEQGNAEAQFELGVAYIVGRGVPKNDAEAVKWWRKAAEQGHAEAQNNLGFMYANGRGVPEDKAEALKWYRKAAEQGHANAQYNLGIMYDEGTGVPQNQAEALNWVRKAAEQGHKKAKWYLEKLEAK